MRENHKTVLAPASANCQTAGEKSTYQPTPRTALLSANVAWYLTIRRHRRSFDRLPRLGFYHDDRHAHRRASPSRAGDARGVDHPARGDHQGLSDGDRDGPRAPRHRPGDPGQRAGGDHGAFGLGQVHPDEHRRLPRRPDRRDATGSTDATWRRCPSPSWRGCGAARSASCSRPSSSCPARRP